MGAGSKGLEGRFEGGEVASVAVAPAFPLTLPPPSPGLLCELA